MKLIVPSCLLLCFGAFAFGQGQEFSRFTGSVGAGFTTTVGSTSNNLDSTGWNVAGGFGVNITNNMAAMVDLGYNYLGVNNNTLTNLGVPGGDVRIFTAMLDPVVHVTPHRPFDLYFTGGGGMIHQYREFTTPTVATADVYNPFFGLYSANFTANQAISSYSVIKPGYDVGAGIAFGSKWHGKFFAEARYYHMFNTNSHTDFIPVTFGFRW